VEPHDVLFVSIVVNDLWSLDDRVTRDAGVWLGREDRASVLPRREVARGVAVYADKVPARRLARLVFAEPVPCAVGAFDDVAAVGLDGVAVCVGHVDGWEEVGQGGGFEARVSTVPYSVMEGYGRRLTIVSFHALGWQGRCCRDCQAGDGGSEGRYVDHCERSQEQWMI